jgi:hypothetical protein
MTVQTLMALYPQLFASATPAPVPVPAAPVSPIATAPPGTPMPPRYDANGELPAINPEQDVPPQYQTLPPTTGPVMTPEPATVNAPTPAQDGPSGPVQASNAPAKRKGLLGFLGDVGGAVGSLIAPEPGSFMDSAYKNTIYNAKGGMQDYQRQQVTNNIATQEAMTKLHNLQTSGEFKIAGNNIFHIKPDGSYELIQPTDKPSDTESLINLWSTTTDPAKKKLIEQAIRGYQWSPWVLGELRKTKVDAATAGARARGAAAGSIPPGFHLVE